MRNAIRVIYILFALASTFYLLLPSPKFPDPPSDALQSDEPADTETPLRRAYFTNLTREEVIKHYRNQFMKSSFAGIPMPALRLNYPPEEAQTKIRDQTRSTFLEEIVHPFRESFYINGFEPKNEKDTIIIKKRPWRQKIIVRYIPSSAIVRVSLMLVAFLASSLLVKEWLLELKRANND